jgi:hypothetical protein
MRRAVVAATIRVASSDDFTIAAVVEEMAMRTMRSRASELSRSIRFEMPLSQMTRIARPAPVVATAQ